MKKSVIFGAVVIALGLLIGLGPQFLFKVCEAGCCGNLCNISAQAETGVGLFIIALGVCLMVYTDPKTQLGLFIGIFLAGIVALAIPHALIGGCGGMTMDCRRVAFPALTIESTVLLVFSAIMMAVIIMQKQGTESSTLFTD
jgi:hypothetical protein